MILRNPYWLPFLFSFPHQNQFERAFKQFDPEAHFLYFKSFRRSRIDFTLGQAATKARIFCNNMKFGEENINCYYAEVRTWFFGCWWNKFEFCIVLKVAEMVSSMLLQPPALEKQFLISPPASPPEGWQPVEEAQPMFNMDLHRALSNLIPGSIHELHPANGNQPGINLYVASAAPGQLTVGGGSTNPSSVIKKQNSQGEDWDEDEDEEEYESDEHQAGGGGFSAKMKIQQTACPPRASQ